MGRTRQHDRAATSVWAEKGHVSLRCLSRFTATYMRSRISEVPAEFSEVSWKVLNSPYPWHRGKTPQTDGLGQNKTEDVAETREWPQSVRVDVWQCQHGWGVLGLDSQIPTLLRTDHSYSRSWSMENRQAHHCIQLQLQGTNSRHGVNQWCFSFHLEKVARGPKKAPHRDLNS